MKLEKPLLYILVGASLVYLTGFIPALNPKTQYTTEKQQQVQIEKWYDVAENSKYKIFTGRVQNYPINTTVVMDLEKNLLLTPGASCEMEIPKELASVEGNEFYNESVGIIELGPYKSIYHNPNTGDFEQHVQNAGCLAKEGIIKITTDETKRTAECTITVEYEHLGC